MASSNLPFPNHSESNDEEDYKSIDSINVESNDTLLPDNVGNENDIITTTPDKLNETNNIILDNTNIVQYNDNISSSSLKTSSNNKNTHEVNSLLNVINQLSSQIRELEKRINVTNLNQNANVEGISGEPNNSTTHEKSSIYESNKAGAYVQPSHPQNASDTPNEYQQDTMYDSRRLLPPNSTNIHATNYYSSTDQFDEYGHPITTKYDGRKHNPPHSMNDNRLVNDDRLVVVLSEYDQRSVTHKTTDPGLSVSNDLKITSTSAINEYSNTFETYGRRDYYSHNAQAASQNLYAPRSRMHDDYEREPNEAAAHVVDVGNNICSGGAKRRVTLLHNTGINANLSHGRSNNNFPDKRTSVTTNIPSKFCPYTNNLPMNASSNETLKYKPNSEFSASASNPFHPAMGNADIYNGYSTSANTKPFNMPTRINVYQNRDEFVKPSSMFNNVKNMPSQHGYSFEFNEPVNVNHRRKVMDLPEFNGKPEQWPMFIASFIESTKAFAYTDLENNFRLQKCLKGEAKSAVESLLIYPHNVSEVISQLEFMYGRADYLIKSQILQVRKVNSIDENHLDQIIPYAIKVKNMATFLETTKIYQHLANPMLIEELVNKLPMNKRLDWAKHSINIQPYPTVHDFSLWINQLARLISTISSPLAFNTRPHPDKKSYRRDVLLVANQSTEPSNISCLYCKSNHGIAKCENFIKVCVADRWIFIKKYKLCFACLRPGHNVLTCFKKFPCTIDGCRRYHHKLLHEDKNGISSSENNVANLISTINENDLPEDQTFNGEVVLSCQSENRPNLNPIRDPIRVLFKIVPITVYGQHACLKTYALIDEGSSVSLIDESIANELKLDGEKAEPLNLQWFGNITSTISSKSVNIDICGTMKGCQKVNLQNVRTVKNIQLPSQSLSINQLHTRYHYLKNLPIADYNDATPKILIGLDNSHVGFISKSIKGTENNDPVVIYTKLGCIVYGKTCEITKPMNQHISLLTNIQDQKLQELHELVKEYFTTENFGVTTKDEPLESESIKRARQILQNTTKMKDFRYETGLLWKFDDIQFPSSLQMAMNRLHGVENKLKKDPDLALKYNEIINSYVTKGYARKLSDAEVFTLSPRTWYLPHFCVKNPAKPNKLRLVFDAAATVNGISLNSMLLSGPDENEPLTAVLYKFRQHEVAICGDIKEMFHQVHIRIEDQNAQRFIWRNTATGKIETYQMISMIFGASCSPCSAQFIKNENARKYMNKYPEAVKSILHNHYVDDYVTSYSSELEAINETKAIIHIHKQAGFELRNFVSNSKNVLSALSENDLETSSMDDFQQNLNMEDETCTDKILGLFWNIVSNEFKFELKFFKIDERIWNENRCPTKRELMGIIMSIYDPFGFVANFMIYTKVMMQEVWRNGVNWGDPIPSSIYNQFLTWKCELPNIKHLRVPRCYVAGMMNNSNDVQIHIFVDASEVGFAAVAYFRVTLNDGTVKIAFIAGKTKCAPQKLLSIPRLELQSALLGVRLKDIILKEHDVIVNRIVLWSDSKTVIQWIESDHRKFKPFVAHRIAEILDSTNVGDWRWLPSKLNVADSATRVDYPIRYDENNVWIKGPEFLLKEENDWPILNVTNSQDDCYSKEIRPKYNTILSTRDIEPIINIDLCSKYIKVLRITAWVIRYQKNCYAKYKKKSLQYGELTVQELNDAEIYLCKQAQQQMFPGEYEDLKNDKVIMKQSGIYQLSPYLDKDGVIRIEGRIDHAIEIPFNTRRPIILHKDHSLAKLIISQYHNNMHHQNQESIICEIRKKFWIPSIRNAVKKAKRDCNVCKINYAKPEIPLMGQLPPDRLTPFIRPFTYTGLDFFGPLFVTIGRRQEKRWVALFTCLTIRAVHLEMATDLSTDACLLCIRNFINRRGVSLRIRSDNGTNFVGANRELSSIDDFLDHGYMQQELSKRNIEWLFNCPGNPNAGGCWERLVQSIKRILFQVLKEKAPHVETLCSVLIEAENIVNGRPLTHVAVSPDEPEPLTPNHFILGTSNSTQTPGPEDEKLFRHKKQWRIAQQLKNSFWKRWVNEYLPTLTRRTKWYKRTRPLEIGDLVIICDSDVPRSQWRRGVVQEVHKAKDGQIRSAKIKTSNGIIKRPTSKLAVLDIEGKSCESIYGGRNVVNNCNRTKVDGATTVTNDNNFAMAHCEKGTLASNKEV